MIPSLAVCYFNKLLSCASVHFCFSAALVELIRRYKTISNKQSTHKSTGIFIFILKIYL